MGKKYKDHEEEYYKRLQESQITEVEFEEEEVFGRIVPSWEEDEPETEDDDQEDEDDEEWDDEDDEEWLEDQDDEWLADCLEAGLDKPLRKPFDIMGDQPLISTIHLT